MGEKTLSKADIWNIKNDIVEAINSISECVDYDRNTFLYHGASCFNNLEERVKLLKAQIINTEDYELAKQIASCDRGLFVLCANRWCLCEKYWAEYGMLVGVHELLYDIYRWLATEYYKISFDDVDKYYMRDSRLYDRETKQEYTYIEPQQETEREKKYFAKAIKAGFMEKGGDSYRWLHNNRLKASLGYFLNKVFNPRGTAQIPYQRMEKLFNVPRLDTATNQALTAKNPQRWRIEIDSLFDD